MRLRFYRLGIEYGTAPGRHKLTLHLWRWSWSVGK